MAVVILTILGLAVAVGVVILIRTLRTVPKPLPRIDLSETGYERALDAWLKDVEKGKVSGPLDFPSYGQWVGLETMEYHKQHGVWPGSPS